jgi:DNA gyrase subunit A
VAAVYAASEQAHIVLATKDGYFLRFPLSQIPFKKKTAVGVRGMKLSGKDAIDAVYFLEGNELPEVTFHDKPVYINRLRISSRDTKGTKARA